jgi:hypothetical protein
VTGLPTTEQWQKMLTDHVDDMTEVINMVESQRALIKDYQRQVTRAESLLAESHARERSLGMKLRMLASRWSRQPEGSTITHEVAGAALSAVLDGES